MAVDYLGALGAGADIDSKNLVESLVAAERAPRETSLNSKIEKSEAKISAYSVVLASLQSLSVAFNKLNDANDFTDYSVAASNNLTATGSDAYKVETTAGQITEGIYSLEVASLATNDRKGSSVLYESVDTSLNSGRDIVITVTASDGSTSSIPVPSPTPQKIVDLINQENIGVTASIVDTGATSGGRYKIVVQGDTGVENNFQIAVGGMLSFDKESVASADVNISTDSITLVSHGASTGDVFHYDAGGGAAINGLTDGATYFVIRSDEDTLKLAASAPDALANIAIDLTGTGNDEQSFSALPQKTSVILTSAVGDSTPVVTTTDVSTATSELTITGHGFATGDVITYNASGGVAIGGLVDSGEYHVIRVDANTIKLASSSSDATSGEAILLTGEGNDSQTITGDTNDSITISNHGYLTGDLIRYESNGGTSVGGLSDGTLYHVIRIDENTLKLASSSEDAAAGINIDLTGTGNDSQSFTGPMAVGLDTANVSTSNDTLTMTGHGYSSGDLIRYSANGGSAIGGLEDHGVYYVIKVDADTFQLAATATDASSGSNISLASTGNSSQFFTSSQDVEFSDQLSTGADAVMVFNGVSVTRPTNRVSDLINGLTINLSGVTASASTIAVTQSTALVKERLQELVDAYNAVDEQFSKLSDPESTEDLGGALSGDGSFRNLKGQVKDLFTASSSTPTSTLRYLTEIGISFSQSGVLEIDDEVLDENLNSRFSDIVSIFSADTNNQTNFGDVNRGLAGDAIFKLKALTSSDGPVLTPQKTQSTKISDYQEDLDELDRRMEQVYQRYLAQFTAMETAVDKINSTREFLTSTLENLPFTNKNR